jgi:hypothetical protein
MKLFKMALTAVVLMASFVVPQRLAAEPQSIVGDWEGQIETGTSKLAVMLHVERTKEGKLEASLQSIEKHQFNVEVESIRFSSPDFHFAIEGGKAVYDAKLSNDSARLVGVWKQGESAMPLIFQRLTDDFVRNMTSRPTIEFAKTWMSLRVAMQQGIGRLRMLMTAYAVSTTHKNETGKTVVQVL